MIGICQPVTMFFTVISFTWQTIVKSFDFFMSLRSSMKVDVLEKATILFSLEATVDKPSLKN